MKNIFNNAFWRADSMRDPKSRVSRSPGAGSACGAPTRGVSDAALASRTQLFAGRMQRDFFHGLNPLDRAARGSAHVEDLVALGDEFVTNFVGPREVPVRARPVPNSQLFKHLGV